MLAKFTSYFGSPVARLKSLNSNWMVVISDVLLSGDHFGACAFLVNKLTSENGIPDSDSKHGNNLSAKSV